MTEYKYRAPFIGEYAGLRFVTHRPMQVQKPDGGVLQLAEGDILTIENGMAVVSDRPLWISYDLLAPWPGLPGDEAYIWPKAATSTEWPEGE